MKKRFFPWRLFWSFFFALVVMLEAWSAVTLGVASYLYDFSFFIRPSIWFLSCCFIVSLLAAAALSYRFSLPLRRVILKALRMANKQLFFQISGREIDEESLFESEPGEYFELEQALDQIRRKMKKRREQLAHEREESETLMSSIEDGVVNVAPDGRLLYFNSGFAKHFLAPEQVRTSGETHMLLTQVLRDQEVLQSVDRALQEGVGGNMLRTMVTLVSGGARDFSVTISALRDPKTREIYGALGLFHDITQLKQAEKIRMEFVENASHELRTPLTSVKGYLETFKEDFFAGRYDEASSFLNIISKNVDRLTALVNDLLTISTLEQGSELEFEEVSVDRITQDVIDRMVPFANEKNVVIHYQNRDVNIVKADPRRLEQVIENLVANAIKYGASGGKVEVVWEKNPVEKTISLIVKDFGPGIPEEHQARLFERFYRVDKARSREVGGTGLGLAIVKHIVQSHGGTVAVSSSLGRGAEFRVRFPQR